MGMTTKQRMQSITTGLLGLLAVATGLAMMDDMLDISGNFYGTDSGIFDSFDRWGSYDSFHRLDSLDSFHSHFDD
jgi:hypothetical protein